MTAGKLFLAPIGQGHEIIGLTTSGLVPLAEIEKRFERTKFVRNRARILLALHALRHARAMDALAQFLRSGSETSKRRWMRNSSRSALAAIRHSRLIWNLTGGRG